MAVNTYECMLILDANRYARDPEGVSGQIGKFVEKHGGEMLVSRLWEERRLAYPIAGHRKGAYWLSYFKLESEKVGSIERDCQLSDSILRSLTLRVDERIADALVGHAAGVQAKPTPAPTTTPEASDSDAPEAEEAAAAEAT